MAASTVLPNEVFGPNAPLDPTRFLFHYTSLEVAAVIALSERFRFGRFEQTNDPREFKAIEPIFMHVTAGPGTGDPRLDPDEEKEVTRRINEARLNFRVGCFTRDRRTGTDGSMRRMEARGYANHVMWAHYGGRMTGVCIAFDRLRLEEEIRNQLGAYAPVYDRVHYVRGDVRRDMFMVDTRAARIILGGTVEHAISQGFARSLFIKNIDWRTEYEWRVVVSRYLDKDDCFLNLADKGIIVGIVFGEQMPDSYLPVVYKFAEIFDCSHGISRCVFDSQSCMFRLQRL